MTITKTVDRAEIIGNFSNVQLRELVVEEENGVEVSRYFHRRVINPGDDLSNESQEIKELCETLHTAEVVSAYQASLVAV